MIKVYGAEICIDCRNYKSIQKARGFEAEYVDITENTTNLKEFLKLRDTEAIFEPVRANSGIGIPLFINENGEITFELDEAMAWIGQPPIRPEEIVEKRSSCGINGCK